MLGVMKLFSDVLPSVLGTAYCIELGGMNIYQSLLAFRQVGRQIRGNLALVQLS